MKAFKILKTPGDSRAVIVVGESNLRVAATVQQLASSQVAVLHRGKTIDEAFPYLTHHARSFIDDRPRPKRKDTANTSEDDTDHTC